MVRKRQRRKTLARDRWERQQSARQAADARRHKISLVIGVVVGLLAAAALVWLVIHLVQAEDKRTPTPTPVSVAPQTPFPTPGPRPTATTPASGIPSSTAPDPTESGSPTTSPAPVASDTPDESATSVETS